MKIDIPILASFLAIFSSCLLSAVNALTPTCEPIVVGTGEATFFAGQTIDVGTIVAQVVGDELKVTFTTEGDWYLQETHLWVGDDLEDMPHTKKGSPKIGNFPYSDDFVEEGDVQSSSFTIPLNDAAIGFSCPGADANYLIAAHAAVAKQDDDGNIVQTETAWGDGDRFVEKGMWGTYQNITISCDCDEDEDEEDDPICETAFAYMSDSGTCFEDIPPSFERWGWSNGPLTEGTHTMKIYAAAGQCVLSKGTEVGSLSIDYDGTDATVTYSMTEPFYMTEVHLYVGSDVLPSKKGKGKKVEYTVAPGQYPIGATGLEVSTYTATISDLSGEIYVVAHAVVCGDYGPDRRFLRGST